MTEVTIYTKPWCLHCSRAKRLLRRHAAVIREVRTAGDTAALRAELRERFNVDTFPQIIIGERHVGGASSLAYLDRTGQLEPLLVQQAREVEPVLTEREGRSCRHTAFARR